METVDSKCTRCGRPVPPSARAGRCPRCLFDLATIVDSEGSIQEHAATHGHRLQDYELLEKLGQGGMGVVYRARQLSLTRIVAVKMIRAGALATQQELLRFNAEAKAVARLQHPNVVGIYEVGAVDGDPYFSMEYVEGTSLSKKIGRTPLPPEKAARFTQILAEAVAYAHSRGVLHRDLKPANVLIGPNETLKITDFGLAADKTRGSNLTRPDMILGTPSYMSPEQAAGKPSEITELSDVYSLGAILYDMLTARPPFRADTAVETIRQVIDLDPAPPRTLNANVSRELETICLACLAKKPEHRYQSAAALAEDLGRFLRKEPIKIKPPGFPARTLRWAQRNPSLAAMLSTMPMLILVLSYGALGYQRQSREQLATSTKGVSESVEHIFEKIAQYVVAVSRSPDLVEMLRTNSTSRELSWQTNHNNQLYIFLNRSLNAHEPTNHMSLAPRLLPPLQFENLLLANLKGDVLAFYNPDASVTLTNVARRDYFLGATDLRQDYYISKLYKSHSDRTYKIGVVTTVKDKDGTAIGVMAGMVGTSSTALASTADTKFAIIAEMDPSDSPAPSWAPYGIFWHQAYTNNQQTIIATTEFPATLTNLLERNTISPGGRIRVQAYADPAGKAYPEYSGKWVAAFVKLRNAPLVVIGQTRDRVTPILAIGCTIVCGFIAIVAGWESFRRSRRLQQPQPPEDDES